MRETNRWSSINRKQKDILFYFSLAIIFFAVFLGIGEKPYVLFDDSYTYIGYRFREGVMPIYPLFLHINRLVFGEAGYLYAVMLEQTALSAFCVISFVGVVKRKFSISYFSAYIVFFLALLTFTTELPECMMTKAILTEGIAYALFYMFAVLLLYAVWEKSYRYLAGLWFMTLFLSLLRSQLQLLYGVCGLVFLYIMFIKSKAGALSKLGHFAAGLLGCILVGVLGILATIWLNTGYQKAVVRVEEKKAAAQTAEEVKETEPRLKTDAGALDDVSKEQERSRMEASSMSQYVTLIFSRGMYEADYEDYRLFEDDQTRELYLYLYETADTAQCRYEYATPGLWMWKDIVGGIGKVGVECFYAQEIYYKQIHPELDIAGIKSQALTTIGFTLLKQHFVRFLYHTVMMLPQAFICTVFFQVASVYLLCHIITLFLYLSAAGLTVWAFADKRISNRYGEFMAAVLVTNLVLVITISLIFFGQQRYLVYTFGLFYIAYFLLVCQLWKRYGASYWEKMKKWIKRS